MPDSVYKSTKVSPSLHPAARTSSANGTAVDTSALGGADEVLVLVSSGVVTDGTHTISVEESADGSTGWAAITGSRVNGTATVLDTTAADDNATQFFSVTTSLQYVRAVTTVSGTTTGGIYGVSFVNPRVRHQPAN